MVDSAIGKYYRSKRVLVTGHTGFKGSWLLAMLNTLGAEVMGYALDPEEKEKSLYSIIEGNNFCKSVISDIRDGERLKKEITSFQPDIIFHLAAQPLVRYSYEHPVETFEVNTMGTANLLDAVRPLQKKCVVVIITTDKVYENREWIYPYREIDRLGGYDPYSASKATTELVAESFRSSFFNLEKYDDHRKSIATARAGNVIGGGDWSKDRIIPDIIHSLENNKSIVVRNPDSVRPWQHVLEPVYGYLMLGHQLDLEPVSFSGAWNFGPYPHDIFKVIELVNKAVSIWGSGEIEIRKDPNEPHEAKLLKLDINKSIEKLGWAPVLIGAESIRYTIEWYKSSDKKAITNKQIKDYLQLRMPRCGKEAMTVG